MKSVLFNHRGFGYAPAALLLVLTAACGTSSSNGPQGQGGGYTKPIPDVPIDTVNTEPRIVGNLPVSKNCEKCHTTLYKEWATSAHSRGIFSVATVAETNGLYNAELARQPGPDPQQFCVNCHSPLVTLAVLNKAAAERVDTATLPFKDPSVDESARAEGIGCTTCHSYRGSPQRSVAGLAVYQDDFDLSNNYYGPFDDPAETTAHTASKGFSFGQDSSQELCVTCHNVFFDRNGDKNIENPVVGADLVLQTTSIEYDLYQKLGGTKNCVTCHMPVLKGVTRVADGAMVGTDAQKAVAPSRVVRSHKFVGVDYPLDDAPDETASDRQQLLAQGISFNAVNFALNNGLLTFDTTLENTDTGHNYPTGFAFSRQLFIEVLVTNSNNQIVGESGHLDTDDEDLCDATSLKGGFGNFLKGCDVNKPDDQLVNLQLELVSQIQPNVVDDLGFAVAAGEAKETVIQNLAGGAVVRIRPFDKKPLNPLKPKEKRSYKYAIKVNGNDRDLNVSVKLRFRNLPPYFLRALGNLSRPQQQEINTAVSKLKVTDITSTSAIVK